VSPLSLLDWRPASAPASESALQARYEEWLAANPGVYQAVVRLAREWRARRGPEARVGIATLWEHLRWTTSLGDQGDDYRLNNSWRSRLARDVMRREVDLRGVFEVRELRS
jgi:hypothetical protein